MRRTKEEAAETRQAIVKAAEKLFLEKGYELVSLDEIAALAGTSRGAIHWHFRNKLGLLFAIRDELRAPMQDLAERLSTGTRLVALSALGDAIEHSCIRFQADPRRRRMLKVIFSAEWSDTGDEAVGGQRLEDQLRLPLLRIFEAAHRNNPLPPPWTPKSATLAFNALLHGLISEWARGAEDFELVPDVVAIVRVVLAAWEEQPADGVRRSHR